MEKFSEALASSLLDAFVGVEFSDLSLYQAQTLFKLPLLGAEILRKETQKLPDIE